MQQALGGEKVDPVRVPRVGLGQQADQRVCLKSVGVGRNVVELGQQLGGMRLGAVIETAVAGQELHDQQRRLAVVDIGHGQRAGFGQIAQHHAFDSELRFSPPVHLDHHLRRHPPAWPRRPRRPCRRGVDRSKRAYAKACSTESYSGLVLSIDCGSPSPLDDSAAKLDLPQMPQITT